METEQISKGYNGWRNYETWSIALFIDNDEAIYNEVREKAKATTDKYDFRKWLKEFITYDFLEVEKLNPFQQQLITASLDDVSWEEVANHYIDEE